jgi:hypothetical protein
MKTISLLVLAITLSFKVNGQANPTLQETKDWIKEKMELYQFTHDLAVINPFSISYDDCNLIISEQVQISGMYPEKYVYIIQIRLLSKITFEDCPLSVFIYIRLTNNSKEIKKVFLNTNKTSYVNELHLMIRNSIKEDNMETRLTKAFANLAILCGGKETKEAY